MHLDGRSLLVGGDVIVALNGQSVTAMEGLQARLQQAHPGQEGKLTLLRDATRMQVQVALGQRPTATP